MKSRQTRQKEVIEEEIRKTKTFFNAEALLEKVAKVDKKIGIATIYRFLKDARERNQIYSYTCQGKTIYSSTKEVIVISSAQRRERSFTLSWRIWIF